MRCRECNAAVPIPTGFTAVTVRCPYCQHEQPIANVELRQQLKAEDTRARLAHEQRQQELEQRKKEHDWKKERAEREDKAKRSERRRARFGGWIGGLGTLLVVLIGPAIVAVTVFDLPARLGYGASGSDRLEQMQTQLAGLGCKVAHPIEAEYVSSTVSELIGVSEGQCIRAFAAGGPDHHRLALKLFAADSTEVAHTAAGEDPQLQYCSATAQTLRLQIDVGSSKGRLSHMVLTCPPPPPKPKPPKPTGKGHHH